MTESNLPPHRHRSPHPRPGSGKGITIAAVAMIATFSLPIAESAKATQNKAGEETIAQCIRTASGGKAWLEKTLWGLRDQEGGWIGAEVANTNGSHDLGPLQINSWWVPRIADRLGRSEAEIRQWLRYDACFNAGAARWIFLSGLHATGDYWKAVGVYHSPTKWRQRRYMARVAVHMTRRFGDDVFWQAEASTTARNMSTAIGAGRKTDQAKRQGSFLPSSGNAKVAQSSNDRIMFYDFGAVQTTYAAGNALTTSVTDSHSDR